jgi:hypothetical protein
MSSIGSMDLLLLRRMRRPDFKEYLMVFRLMWMQRRHCKKRPKGSEKRMLLLKKKLRRKKLKKELIKIESEKSKTSKRSKLILHKNSRKSKAKSREPMETKNRHHLQVTWTSTVNFKMTSMATKLELKKFKIDKRILKTTSCVLKVRTRNN